MEATTRAILLTDQGFVADGPGENIFVVKDGRILTPPLSTSILPGITRDTVIEIAQRPRLRRRGGGRDPHRPVPRGRGLHDRDSRRGTPVRAVDDVELGVGDVTLEIQRTYLDVVNGRNGAAGATGSTSSRCATPSPERLSRRAREHGRDDAVLVVVGERRAARQAEPALEEPRRDVAAERRGATRRPAAGASASRPGAPRCPRASSARRIASRSAPKASGSTTMHVSQRVRRP